MSLYSSFSLFSYSLSFFYMILFQWFLIELSVLPLINLANIDHFELYSLYSKNNNHSSSSVQDYFLISGFKWLCHLSQHCFPSLSLICLEITDHFLGPYYLMRVRRSLSSSIVQFFFLLFIKHSIEVILCLLPFDILDFYILNLNWF